MTPSAASARTEARELTCSRQGCANRWPAEVRVLLVPDLVQGKLREFPIPSHPVCETCQRADEERVRCEERAAIAAQLGMIPERFAGAQPDHPQILDWALGFIQGASTSLVVLGDVGVGKTHQVWGAWARIVADRPQTSLVAWRVSSLLAELRFAGFAGLETVRGAQNADLLLLDDLGVARASDWSFEQLNEILDERYQCRRPTIVTSNLSFAELAERVGQRFVSRLAESARVVVLEGPDRRVS